MPQNDDELELRDGDIVDVMEKCDDGWFVGKSPSTLSFLVVHGQKDEEGRDVCKAVSQSPGMLGHSSQGRMNVTE